MRITEVDQQVSQAQLDALEKVLDRVFAQIGIDIEFTRHFLDRVNDERNVRQITISELAQLFKKEFVKWGKPIARLGPDAEAVMKDLATDINIPFALKWNSASSMLELVAKTVMRKKNFRTPNKEFPVEGYVLTKRQLQRINENLTEQALPRIAPGVEVPRLPGMSAQQAANTFRNVINLSPGFQSPRVQNSLSQFFQNNPGAFQAANDNFGPRQTPKPGVGVGTALRGVLGRALGAIGMILTPTAANQGEQETTDRLNAIYDFQQHLLNTDPRAYLDFVQAEWNALPAETQAEYAGGPWDPRSSADYNAAEEAARMLQRGQQFAPIQSQPIPVAPDLQMPDAPVAPVSPQADTTAPRLRVSPDTPLTTPVAPTAPSRPEPEAPLEIPAPSTAPTPSVEPVTPPQPATPEVPPAPVTPARPQTQPKPAPQQPPAPTAPSQPEPETPLKIPVPSTAPTPSVEPVTPPQPATPEVPPAPVTPARPQTQPKPAPQQPPAPAPIQDLPPSIAPGVVTKPGTLTRPAPAPASRTQPSRQRTSPRRRPRDWGGGDPGDYNYPLIKSMNKHTPRSFESADLISEGGAMPGVGAIHIDEINPTLDQLEKSLGIDLKNNTLGSVGKRKFSGDIDVALQIEPGEIPAFIEKLKNNPLIHDIAKSSVIMTKVKIVGFDSEKSDGRPRTGFVQVDFMPGDPGWLKTYYHSPSETESKYKGVYRNIMIATIAAVYNRQDSEQKLSDGRALESVRYMWSPTDGLVKIRRTPELNKKGDGYTKKNRNEIIDGPWRQPDEIASQLGLGDASVLNSFETLLDAVKKNYTQQQVKQIIQGFVDNSVVQDAGIPSELQAK
jgi:hypothetical protein